jgi:hypothetical protein
VETRATIYLWYGGMIIYISVYENENRAKFSEA